MSVSGRDRPTGVQNKRLAVQHTLGDKESGIGPVLELRHVVALKINVMIKLGAGSASKCVIHAALCQIVFNTGLYIRDV